MRSKFSRLPSRFPVGTRFVIEGRGGHIHAQYLEFPDGRQIDLPAGQARQPAPRRYAAMRQAVRQKVAAGKF
jgi:hypothetical protein